VVVKDSTPQERKDWQENELSWWAGLQLNIVAVMSIIQVVMLGLMMLLMYMNSRIF
jgi:hypothetical protein|tara:strand:+ start:289 stop:456 length:168 start_codon:yes stop_codon:yes gene_type:complete